LSFKKIIVLFIAALMICLSGCNKLSDNGSSSIATVPQEEGNQKKSLSLLYSASDTFNPYTCTTDLNRALCKLVFDSLIKLNNNFEAEYILADTVSVKGKSCTVTLKNVQFTDGSIITADDVVYSYNLAKKSKEEYAYNLYEVKSVKAKDDKTVVFSLTRHDPYFERLLDFPIIKEKSDKKTDEDGIFLTPIGNGRYTVNEEKNTLTANDKYFLGSPNIEKINLVNAPDPESVTHYVERGTTDMYYTDISGGNIVRMSGKKQEINLNNMVYIGINDSYGQLDTKELRYAISAAIDRESICQAAYHNNAVAATGFFNPVIADVKAVQNLQSKANTEISIENLKQIGYNKLNSDSMRVNSSGNRLRLTLLVNSDNNSRVAAAEKIVASLKSVGIEVTLQKRSYAQYVKALESGNFQLYLGEIKTLANLDISELVVAGGSCAWGISEKKEDKDDKGTESKDKDKDNSKNEPEKTMSIKDIIDGFYGGKNSITDVANILQTEMPVIPVCFRRGLLFHSNSIENVEEASEGDIYYSIIGYTIKK